MSFRRFSQTVAIVMVASALLVDRAAVGAPMTWAAGPQAVASVAGRAMQRLTMRFRRVVPPLQLGATETIVTADRRAAPSRIGSTRMPAHAPATPFFFRLPPPAFA